MVRFLFLFVSVVLGNLASYAQQQADDENTAMFKEVKMFLANNQEKEAISILEGLYEKDPSNANVQYLLGYCYVKQRQNIPQAVKLLEKASSNYASDYDPNSLKETRVSEYVYYYLIIAYSLNGQCAKCEETLNKFYDVYSYFDEWYLVEGQKWVRECHKENKPEEEEEKEEKERQEKTKVKEEKEVAEKEQEKAEKSEAPELAESSSQSSTEDKSTATATSNNQQTGTASQKEDEQGVKKRAKNKKKKDKKKEKEKVEEQEEESREYTEVAEQVSDIDERNSLEKQKIEVRWKENFLTDNTKGKSTKSPQFRDRLLQYDPEKGEVVSKEIHYTTQSSLYGVQVGAFFSPKYTSEFKNLKNIEVYIDQNGVFRYVIGRLVYKMQAEKLLDYVRNMGYADAFIVDINGGKYVNEVVTVNKQSLKKKFDREIDFRVQIGAFRRDLPENIARHYLQLDNIKENVEGDLTILTIGSFNNYDTAKDFSEKVKLIGVEDAFVVAYAEDAKISIEEAKKLSDLIEVNQPTDKDEMNTPFEKKTNKRKNRSSDL